MKVLVIGSGGREHCLAHFLQQSPDCTELWSIPGNPGMQQLGLCLPVWSVNDHDRIVGLARGQSIDLAVIGPEVPLAAGLTDQLREARIPTFGPSARAAQIEASKVYARRLMSRMGVPQPHHAVCTSLRQVEGYCHDTAASDRCVTRYVVKADGLAAGKGAIVCDNIKQTVEAARRMFEGEFGKAGETVLVEERLDGEEVSLFVLTDGKVAVPLQPAQDYKRAFDGDKGPNTGGMGAYAPAPVMTPALVEETMKTIIKPTLQGLAEDGAPFQGCLYAGLMIVNGKVYVIEFNCRLGDPETQVVVPLLDQDLLLLMLDVANGTLRDRPLRWKDACATTVVLASNGYPGKYETGFAISGIDDAEQLDCVIVFHAGTKHGDDGLVTAGGRVLNVTGVGCDFHEATARAYAGVEAINFDGKQYRRDIAKRVIDR